MATPQTDRLISIDALRGIAVLGILMMNVQGFAMLPMAYENPTLQMDLTGGNLTAWAFAHTFFAFKFITIFSTLFGAGIVMMAGTGESTGLHNPRMRWLLLIGLIHAYIFWWGDILVSYALIGIIAVKARRMPPAKLAIWGLVLIAVSGVLMVGSAYLGVALEGLGGDASQQEEMMAGMMESWTAAYQAGFLNHIGWNAIFAFIGQLMGLIMLGPRTLGLMFIGMALYKSGFLSASWSHVRYAAIAAIGLVAGIGLSNASTNIMIAGEFGTAAMADGNALIYVGSLLQALGYAATIMLLAKLAPMHLLLAPFAAAGRMAFTNYLTQTLIMTFIFVGMPGLGLFGQVERIDQVKLVLAVWAVQLIWSMLWMSAFRFGPFEWLWRTLTYGEKQPMRKAAA